MNKILLLLISNLLFAVNILNYNVYDRTDRLDIMLTFDEPYSGKIVKSKLNNKIIIKLYDVQIESTKTPKISSKYIEKIAITPLARYTEIVATVVDNNIILKASRTSDRYGLRLRFTTRSSTKQNINKKTSSESSLGNLPLKRSEDISTSYYIVITILVILIIILTVVKRKVYSKQNRNSFSLFKTPIPPTINKSKEEVTIRFQKAIDEKNTVLMLDFLNQSYLILLNENNNILLDKFVDDIPTTKSEFESILQERNEEIDKLLQIEEKQTKRREDILSSFRDKASNL